MIHHDAKYPSSCFLCSYFFSPDIVDKTAGFVARNGAEFENRIRQNEAQNAKFNFLDPTNPYHAYYRNKVRPWFFPALCSILW